jgi:hypothetical protein
MTNCSTLVHLLLNDAVLTVFFSSFSVQLILCSHQHLFNSSSYCALSKCTCTEWPEVRLCNTSRPGALISSEDSRPLRSVQVHSQPARCSCTERLVVWDRVVYCTRIWAELLRRIWRIRKGKKKPSSLPSSPHPKFSAPGKSIVQCVPIKRSPHDTHSSANSK